MVSTALRVDTEIVNGNVECSIQEDFGRIIGTIHNNGKEPYFMVDFIEVKKFRKGFGTLLYKSMEDYIISEYDIRVIRLQVLDYVATKFWESCGFNVLYYIKDNKLFPLKAIMGKEI